MKFIAYWLGSSAGLWILAFIIGLFMPHTSHACPLTILIAIGTSVGVGGGGVAAGVAGALVVASVGTSIGTSIAAATQEQPKYPEITQPDDVELHRVAQMAEIQRRQRSAFTPTVLAGENFLEESITVQRSPLGPDEEAPQETEIT